MPRSATHANRSGPQRGRWWIAAGAILAALSAGVGVAYTPAGSSGDETIREAGHFLEPVGSLSLVSHTDSARTKRAGLRPVRSDEARQVPDSKIRLDVGMKLADAELPIEKIRYRVDDQSVSLTGEVRSSEVRDRIELTARAVTGVQGVDNDIRLASMTE